MHHFKTSLALVSALTLAASAFAQKLETPKVAEKGGQGKAGAPIEQNPDFSEAVKRFQTDFGVTIQLARGDEAVTAQSYDVTTLKAEHLTNALSVLTWVEAELKRYPAGFVKKHGSKNLVLANAYVSAEAISIPRSSATCSRT